MEAATLKAWEEHGVPVPKVYAVDDDTYCMQCITPGTFYNQTDGMLALLDKLRAVSALPDLPHAYDQLASTLIRYTILAQEERCPLQSGDVQWALQTLAGLPRHGNTLLHTGMHTRSILSHH